MLGISQDSVRAMLRLNAVDATDYEIERITVDLGRLDSDIEGIWRTHLEASAPAFIFELTED